MVRAACRDQAAWETEERSRRLVSRSNPEPDRQADSGESDERSEHISGHQPSQGRPDPASDQQPERQRRGGRPVDGAEHGKPDRSDEVGHTEEHVFEGIGPCQVLVTVTSSKTSVMTPAPAPKYPL